jgi:hypothetical protein
MRTDKKGTTKKTRREENRRENRRQVREDKQGQTTSQDKKPQRGQFSLG